MLVVSCQHDTAPLVEPVQPPQEIEWDTDEELFDRPVQFETILTGAERDRRISWLNSSEVRGAYPADRTAEEIAWDLEYLANHDGAELNHPEAFNRRGAEGFRAISPYYEEVTFDLGPVNDEASLRTLRPGLDMAALREAALATAQTSLSFFPYKNLRAHFALANTYLEEENGRGVLVVEVGVMVGSAAVDQEMIADPGDLAHVDHRLVSRNPPPPHQFETWEEVYHERGPDETTCPTYSDSRLIDSDFSGGDDCATPTALELAKANINDIVVGRDGERTPSDCNELEKSYIYPYTTPQNGNIQKFRLMHFDMPRNSPLASCGGNSYLFSAVLNDPNCGNEPLYSCVSGDYTERLIYDLDDGVEQYIDDQAGGGAKFYCVDAYDADYLASGGTLNGASFLELALVY